MCFRLCVGLSVISDRFQAYGPSGQSEPMSDGRIQITAFGQAVNLGASHVETVVHTFLETQGEVYALSRQSDLSEYALRVLVEFSDADIAASVVQKFNGVVLGVSCWATSIISSPL